VKSLKCRFPVAVSGTWKNGEAVANPRTQELLINVTEIDVSDGTAEVAGTAGKAFVSAVLSGWSLYFVENGVGQLNVTTVFAQESVPGKLKAVHSATATCRCRWGSSLPSPRCRRTTANARSSRSCRPLGLPSSATIDP
jgi:hypothetical protein